MCEKILRGANDTQVEEKTSQFRSKSEVWEHSMSRIRVCVLKIIYPVFVIIIINVAKY